MHPLFPALAASLFLMTLPAACQEPSRPNPERFAKDIARFQEQDAKTPPAKGQILFLGSSSIRKWDTKRWFPDHAILNRGFGGSMIQDALHYADQIVFPYAPQTIVLYAGDNDVNKGLTSDEVFRDYVTFAAQVRGYLPETHLVFIAIKPSPKRWKLWPTMKAANERIANRCAREPREHFADIAPLLLGSDGRPQKRFFDDDDLHLSEVGYAAWTHLIQRLLDTL